MIVFIKAQLSSLLATTIDFLVTIVLVETVGVNYLTSTIAGAFAGGITNFIINKYWSFNKKYNGLKIEGKKYIVVWIASIILNAIGSNCLVKILEVPYLISKIIISIIIGASFNYQLQKHYVFRYN